MRKAQCSCETPRSGVGSNRQDEMHAGKGMVSSLHSLVYLVDNEWMLSIVTTSKLLKALQGLAASL